ncbi:MAG: signal transduction histidine kinase [Mycobacterium sp.]|nr:signal transduction histidine kinase [Mycobacterium sp.]
MCAASVLLVFRLHASLLANLDNSISQEAATVAASIAKQSPANPLPAPSEDAAIIQIVDESGKVLTSSTNLDGRKRLFHFQGGRTDPAIASTEGVDSETSYRVAALIAPSLSREVTVYVGLPTTELTQSTQELTAALAVGVPLVTLLLAFVGWLLVGRALGPVEAMRQEAATISGADVHRRLSPPPARDELSRLAGTLNELLSRIQTAFDQRRAFVADAAHELRSPITVLQTTLEVSMRRAETAADREIAADLLAETARLARLVEDLLQLARLDANRAIANLPVDLDDLVLDEVRRATVGARVSIDTSGVSAGRVLGDAHALGRVINNLLDNAIRHASTRVEIDLHGGASFVTLTVCDDGYGIRADDRERVFERFTRLDDARGRDSGGSGLGLAIVRDVVTAHGGQVQIADGIPIGTQMTVTLPAARG